MAKGLGKGMAALLPTEFDTSILLDKSERVQKLLIVNIAANADQPRRTFDEQALKELASSIKRFGVLQPLIVSPLKDGTYRIVAGERRWRASQLAGLKEVPVIIREQEALEELEISLVENVQRVDLSALEQAVSIERLHQQFSMSYKSIAERLGKAETTVSNIVRLLQLPEKAQQALQKGQISEGHARAILALKSDANKQQQLLMNIIDRGWSVRQAEQFVVAAKNTQTTKAASSRMASETPETKKISAKLHAPVSIKRTARGGRLEIKFTTDEELDQILKNLS